MPLNLPGERWDPSECQLLELDRGPGGKYFSIDFLFVSLSCPGQHKVISAHHHSAATALFSLESDSENLAFFDADIIVRRSFGLCFTISCPSISPMLPDAEPQAGHCNLSDQPRGPERIGDGILW